MARNTKKTAGGKRYNVPAETLERARAEMKNDEGSIVAADKVARPEGVTAPKVQAKRPAAFAKSTRVPSAEELVTEYRFVWRELRLLGLLTAGLFAVILIASVAFHRLG